MPNTETAGAGAKPERTPQDYAIEHAEYMAQDAERLLDTINHLNAQRDEDGDAFDSDALARAEEAVTEAFGSVRNGIYEFRKRRDRAAAQPAGAQQPGAAHAALPYQWREKVAELADQLEKCGEAWIRTNGGATYNVGRNDGVRLAASELRKVLTDETEHAALRASHWQAPAAQALDDGCPHGSKHIVHDCMRCGAPVCCGKCCAEDAQAMDAREKLHTDVARAIWEVMREYEDSCDLELEDVPSNHQVWFCADAAIAAKQGGAA